MFKRILVCGAGAIGGTIAAFLARCGHPVTVVDLVAEHVARIRQVGLAITGPVAEFTVRMNALTPSDLRGEFDLVLLAVKAQHTRVAVEMIKSHLAVHGTVVSVQNGLNEYLIAELVGPERTLGCFVHFGADYEAPGHIAYHIRMPLMLGELDGRMTERLRAVHTLLQEFEPNAEMTDNIFGFLWSKLVFSAMMIAQALVKVPTQEFLDDRSYRPLIYRMVGEVARVAAAEGVRLMPFQGFEAGAFIDGDESAMDAAVSEYARRRRGSKKMFMGVYRDLFIRHRVSEVSPWYAPVLRLAERHNIGVPALTTGVKAIASIESGRTSLSNDLAAEVAALLHGAATVQDVQVLQ